MKRWWIVTLFLVSMPWVAQDNSNQVEMQAMMEKMQAMTSPGPQHKALERFLGTWTTSSRITMAGFDGEPAMGESTFDWLMEGRWLQLRGTSTLMGRPYDIYSIIGYDNFKQSYVWTQVTSLDTAMLRSEGDMDPGGKAILFYGTLDEYLTGEHDKMVKTVWRFINDDRIVLEIHDLPIGEKNTKVIEMTFDRKKDE